MENHWDTGVIPFWEERIGHVTKGGGNGGGLFTYAQKLCWEQRVTHMELFLFKIVIYQNKMHHLLHGVTCCLSFAFHLFLEWVGWWCPSQFTWYILCVMLQQKSLHYIHGCSLFFSVKWWCWMLHSKKVAQSCLPYSGLFRAASFPGAICSLKALMIQPRILQ